MTLRAQQSGYRQEVNMPAQKITQIQRVPDAAIPLNRPALGHLWHTIVRQAIINGWVATDVISLTVDGEVRTFTLKAGATYALEATPTA
jgi:hypothetical protein